MKNTSLLLRVFFVLIAISLLGFLWQLNQKNTTEIKASGGTLKEGIIGTPRFINPVLAQSQADLDLTRLLFTPILSIDREGEVYYGLADSLDISENKKIYTLTIKNTLSFSDGSKLNADDVIFTVKSIQDNLIKSPLNTQWQGVQIEKVNQYTITFTLDRPFSDFIYNLQIGVLPSNIWESIDAQEFIFSNYNSRPIGSGPYVIQDIDFEENGVPNRYTLERNHGHIEEPYIKNIELQFFDNEETLIKNLSKNTIGAAYGISPVTAFKLKEELVSSATLPRVFALFFNQEKQPLLKSKKIREAINLGINKQNITENIFKGYASPINSIIGLPEREIIFDQQKAKEIIESENWVLNKDGIYSKDINNTKTDLSFSVSIPNIPDMQAVAESISSDLGTIGIKLIVRSYEQGNLTQDVIRPREYESLLFGYEIEKPSDLYAFWHSSQISDPGLNVSLFKKTSIDAALTNLRTSTTPELQKINDEIIQEYPAVFLFSPSYIYVLPKNVKGTSFSIHKSSDRFNTLKDWYIRTRHIWPLFTNKK
ncbi:MAG: peptide/nickel transport system substrate-binding protein [Crocinitomicaceae bacterium]|jgi:peptide/nickel transport system substrate-binding protein